MEAPFALHPFEPLKGVRGIGGRIFRTGTAITCRFEFDLEADAPMVWPATTARPSRARGLWETTCCEIFLGPEMGSTYLEFNFSPSGAWNAFAFTDYRRGMAETQSVAAVDIVATTAPYALTAGLRCEHPMMSEPALRVGVSAVVEVPGSIRGYFALHHGGDRPDFHRADGFTLRC